MDVLIYEPGAEPRLETLQFQEKNEDGKLRAMQEVVGGFIQTVQVNGTKNEYLIVMDEEGKFKSKAPNRFSPTMGQVFVGTLFVCKKKRDNMVGLEGPDVQEVKALMEEWTVQV